MVLATQILKIAKAEIGYKQERSGRSKYGVWYGEPGFENAAWCAMFVSWVFDKAGMPLHPIQNKKGFAYCPYGVTWFQNNGRFRSTPQVGDILFYDWGKDGVSDHVGIVSEVYPTYIKAIEGNTATLNQSNGGQVMNRARYYPSCLGFARPKYSYKDSFAWNGCYLELRDPLMEQPEIGILQQMLNKLNYNLKVDSFYGVITAKAVKNFQAKNNLEIDGVVGAVTWSTIKVITDCL